MAKSQFALKAAVALSTFAAVGAASAQNAVTNGSFEGTILAPRIIDGGQSLPAGNVDIPGWLVITNAIDWLQSGTVGSNSLTAWGLAAQDGAKFLDLTGLNTGGNPSLFGGVQQTFATTPGVTYDVSFWLGSTAGTAANGAVLGTTGGVTALVSLPGPGTIIGSPYQATTNSVTNAWEQKTFQFIAASSQTTLTFTGVAGLEYIGLDNVSVTAVPEPGSLAMMLAGLAAVGSIALRRRQVR